MKIRAELPNDFFSKGFTPETDPFGKGDLAERLTKLYSNLSQGTVSILDGRWGTGKSVFARQWKHYLETNGVPCIYFDAFAADYVDSPFRAVASAFVRAAKEAQAHDKPVYDGFLNAASKALRIIAAPAAKTAVKAITLGLVGSADIDDWKAAAEEVASGLGDVSEEAMKTVLEGQAADEGSFEALRASLAKLPDLLAKKLLADQGTGEEDENAVSPSLVVIIDELDRCRPDFALGVVEVLKHFFRAERIHFILVTNLNHLLLSVQKRYGVGEEAGEYIQKFYDFIIPFEEPQQLHDATAASLLASRQLQIMLTGPNTADKADLIGRVADHIRAYDMSLRQAERIVTIVVLAQIDFAQQNYRPGILVALLATIKAHEPALFTNIKNRRLNAAQMQAFIKKGNWSDEHVSDRMAKIARYHSDPDLNENDPEYQHYSGDHWRYNIGSRLAILPYLARHVIDRFG
jgi:KAP family P-loop domain